MSFIKPLLDWWNSNGVAYQALEKKEDDLGDDSVKKWIERNPANPSASTLGNRAIDSYAKALLSDLNRVPITSSNIESIKSHLVVVGEQSGRLLKALTKGISGLQADKEVVNELKITLILTYTEKI